MADPNQTPERGDWACPCNGCKKARQQVLKQVKELLESADIMYSWHLAQEFVKKELNKK